MGLYSQNFYQNQRVLHGSINIEPVLTSREGCNVFADLIFRIICVFCEILSTSMYFCCSIYIETAQNSRDECNEFLYLLFWRLSLCLSRDSLSCDTHSLDLCMLFKFIWNFLYFWYIPPPSFAFHTFYFTPIFSYVYYYAKYLFLFLMTLLPGILLFLISAVKGLIWTRFSF